MEELSLLKKYMDIYIQLLFYCTDFGGKRLRRAQLPTFQYFKETFENPNYSMIMPNYKESKDVYDREIVNVYTQGLGSANGIAYRFYNYWMGCKYYPGGIDYCVDHETLNKLLKKINP